MVTTMDEAATQDEVLLTPSGRTEVITIDHMRHVKNRGIVCNIGHFDSEIQIDAPRNYPREEASRGPTSSASSSPSSTPPGPAISVCRPAGPFKPRARPP